MMPTRLIREGILTSDRVNSLSAKDEVFYRRLMSIVDDYGRHDARIAILRAKLYPLQLDQIRESDLARGLAECEKANLVRCYEVDGKPYLQLEDFGQKTRTASKCPDPPPDANKCAQLLTDENNCKQPLTSVHLGAGASEVVCEVEDECAGVPKTPPSGGARNDFESFWQQVPNKIGKGAARAAYSKAIAGGATHDEIVAGLESYRQYEAKREKQQDYRPLHPATWLNGERWTDEVAGGSVARSAVSAAKWESLGPDVHRELLAEVQASEPNIDHRAGNMDTQRAMRKLAKQKGLI